MKKRKPCHECPYKLGLIKTLANPCPQCMGNNYNAFVQFKKHLSGEEGIYPDGDSHKDWTVYAKNSIENREGR